MAKLEAGRGKKIGLFSEEEYAGYIFDLAEITKNVVYSAYARKQAEAILTKQEIVIRKFSIGFSNYFIGGPTLAARVEGVYRSSWHDEPITIVFSEEEILYIESLVTGGILYYHNDGYEVQKKVEINKYVVALFVLIGEYIKEHNPGDYTSDAGNELLNSYAGAQKSLLQVDNSSVTNSVNLQPALELKDRRLFATFKIGKDKLFVVKSFANLVEKYTHGSEYALGTKTKLDFSRDKFNEAAEQYYQIIKEIVAEDEFRNNEMFRDYGYKDLASRLASGRVINLFGRSLDRFYELCSSQELEVTIGSGRDKKKFSVALRKQDPDISLVIAPDINKKGVFKGINVEGEVPQAYQGAAFAYYMDNGYLNRMSPEAYNKLKTLFDSSVNNKVRMKIGRRNLNKFYHQVLPELSKVIQFVENDAETIEKYLLPEAKFSFFLDYNAGKISCLAQAHYGEDKYNLLEVLSGKTLATGRDEEKEQQLVELLRYYFNSIDAVEKAFVIEEDEDAMWTFLEQGVKQLMELGEVSSTDAFKRLKIRDKFNVSVGVKLDSSIMDLSITSSDFSLEELLEILRSYKKKKKFYRLRGGDFVAVENQAVEELAAIFDAMHLAPKEFVKGKMRIPAYRALYLDKMLEQNSNLYSSRDSNFRKLIKDFKAINESDFDVPQSLVKIMRNYQVRGYQWLRTLAAYGFGGILADDMGLGKTLQSIAVLLAAKEAGEQGVSLIVCPASLVYNWQEEFARFAPELKVLLIVGSQKERAEKISEAQAYDVVITSYDLLKRDISEYEQLEFNYEFIDEAQFIKNHTTAAAKSVKVIRSRHRFALTGTPIENRLSELWSIFDYLMPGYLYEYSVFKKELEQPVVKVQDAAAAKRLKQLVMPFILRRLKQDVLKELPEKMEEVRVARFEAKQQALYDGQVVKTLKLVQGQSDDELAKSKIQILAELTRLRQICCDPSLAFSNYTGTSAKRELCMEMVQSAIAGEHKVLIFSQFKSMLELLATDLEREGIAYYMITGETPKEKRIELVRAFNNDATPVFLISLKAGGTGLNLTGADVVIHYDPWWNVAAQNQATDRAHRIGQKKVVSVYKLVAKNSIEEKILKMQEDKRNLAESILAGEGSSIFTMSREELLGLL